jgi:diacylglycerol O-acyltransferase / wax synthase
MRRISMADAGFLFIEKRETPMHVGGLHLFTLPDGAEPASFIEELLDILRLDEEYRRPFKEYVTTGRAGPFGPLYWEKDRNFDIDYHVRHSALPEPGRYRELFMLISRLHSVLLDRSRPLWEIHLIEGLEKRQFAMYQKIHHAAIDGAGAMHMINACYSTRQSARSKHSPFSLELYESYKEKLKASRQERVEPRGRELRNVLEVLRAQFDTTANLLSAMRQFGGAFFGRGRGLAVPWYQVPRTSMNTEVSGSRRFVAQSWEFARIRAVSKAVDGTINDVVLAMCGSALRRYLLAQGELPKQSLKAMTPVSLRDASDLDSANAVGFMVADLATNLADPEARLRQVQASMNAGKALLSGLTRREAILFAQITQVPALLTSVLGLASQFPAFSTVISNVPGPREQLYWNGARLDGIYPVSAIFHGWAINISLVSYNDQIDFGIVACRRSMPQVQRLIDYLEESLQELEAVAGLSRAGGGKRASTGQAAAEGATGKSAARARGKAGATAGAKTRAKTKTKAKAKTRAKAKTKAKTRARPAEKSGRPARRKASARPKSTATAR